MSFNLFITSINDNSLCGNETLYYVRTKQKDLTNSNYSLTIRSILILDRLRARSNDRTAIASSSFFTSSSEPVLTAKKSKSKQTVSAKKQGHSSEDEKNDNVHSH